MKIKFILFAMLISVVGFGHRANAVIQDTTTIEAINKNPRKYHDERVMIEGIVTQFIPKTSESNAKFILKGKFGGLISVNTDLAEPTQNRMYRVVGTVYYGGENLRPFIHEREKICLDCDKVTKPIIKAETPSTVSEVKDDTTTGESNGNTFKFIILIIAVGLIGGIVIFFIKGNAKGTSSSNKLKGDDSNIKEPKYDAVLSEDEFKTIKIKIDKGPLTMKFIQGKLDIVGGADTGKSFRIAGFPTPNGSIVSIGRAEVKGDRSFSHIKLEQSTISRQQAELREFHKKLYIKNLTNVNKTQVDGVELEVGEEVELYPGQTIRMGELELMYSIK